MSDLGRRIRAVRRAVRVRERTSPVSTVYYTCRGCGMSVMVTLARGVSLPSRRHYGDLSAPAPMTIACTYCDARMEIDESTSEDVSGDRPATPYLRVPSRREGARMAAEGRFEAQVVDES